MTASPDILAPTTASAHGDAHELRVLRHGVWSRMACRCGWAAPQRLSTARLLADARGHAGDLLDTRA